MNNKNVRRSVLLMSALCAVVLMMPSWARAGTLPEKAKLRFDTATAKRHLLYLADDSMLGRNTPSPQLEQSAEYIADRFRESGLSPVNGTWFHHYELVRTELGPTQRLTVKRKGVETTFQIKADFIPFENTGSGKITDARIVFAGFGITAPEYGYDDYTNIDARGAVVVVFRGEPNTDDTSKFAGKMYTKYMSVGEKARNAKAHGAIAVLALDAPRATRRLLVTGYSWPSIFPAVPRDALPLTLSVATDWIPAVHVGTSFVNTVFDSVGVLRSDVEAIDSTLTPRSRVLDDVTVSVQVDLVREAVKLRNVVGMVKGSTYPDEYVVLGAHYDHIGTMKAKAADSDTIFNGADDNASGTTGLLMAADAIANADVQPERSVVFIAFSGEEKGLLGSKSYCRTPLLPLNKCVAMVNMDMIGRCEGNKLSIGGNTRCPDLAEMNAAENGDLEEPFTLAYDIERYFYRSDQASFAEQEIPVIFYFTGEHTDYHKITDEVDKLNVRRLVDIARLATTVVWRSTAQPRTRFIKN